MSRAELQNMHRFVLRIRKCDDMPEFVAALQKRNSGNGNENGKCSNSLSTESNGLCASGVENSTEVDLTAQNDNDQQYSNENGSRVEYVEVEVVMDGDINEDGSFKSLYYSTSESSNFEGFPKDTPKRNNCAQKTNDTQPNDASQAISNGANDTAEVQAVKQPDITDDTERPSPPIEPIEPVDPLDTDAAVDADTDPDTPPPTSTEQMLSKCRNQLAILNEQLQNNYKLETKRLNAIANQNRSTIAKNAEDKIDLGMQIETLKGDLKEMQTENVQLKNCSPVKEAENKKLRLQLVVDVQKAIEATKTKQWCVNCKKEAAITQYKLPVCSMDCLFVVL